MEKERGPKMEGRRVGGRGRTKARERGESWEGGGERHRWKGTRLVEEAGGDREAFGEEVGVSNEINSESLSSRTLPPRLPG